MTRIGRIFAVHVVVVIAIVTAGCARTACCGCVWPSDLDSGAHVGRPSARPSPAASLASVTRVAPTGPASGISNDRKRGPKGLVFAGKPITYSSSATYDTVTLSSDGSASVKFTAGFEATISEGSWAPMEEERVLLTVHVVRGFLTAPGWNPTPTDPLLLPEHRIIAKVYEDRLVLESYDTYVYEPDDAGAELRRFVPPK